MREETENRKSGEFTCLIVEDDAAFRTMMVQVIQSMRGNTREAATVSDARQALSLGLPELVLLDNHLPDGRGYELYEEISRRSPELPAIMITGVPHLGEAVALTRNGLFDYLTKPVEMDLLTASLDRALLRIRSRGNEPAAIDWLGDSPAMQAVRNQLSQAARHPAATVLLTGESGTGKDLAARVLHQLTFGETGTRQPFVAVNCSAVPAEMFEAEFFGAEKGAYTGAGQKRQGLVESADGGTLFLDEIGDVPLVLQPKLLRLLETGEYRSLGSTVSRTFSGRLVAATNRVLKADILAGKFREDLYFRMAVMEIALPPLRERLTDLPRLAEALMAQLSAKYSRTPPLLQPADMVRLQRHTYPGNVRELRNVLERSLLKTPADSRWLALEANWEGFSSADGQTKVAEPVSVPAERVGLNLVEAQEYRVIAQAMKDANGGIRRAASLLGMSPQSLLRRLEKWPELRRGG